MMSSENPEIERQPYAGLHLTGLAAVASVHNATLSKPVKQESPTETFPPKSELWTVLTSSYGRLRRRCTTNWSGSTIFSLG